MARGCAERYLELEALEREREAPGVAAGGALYLGVERYRVEPAVPDLGLGLETCGCERGLTCTDG